MSRPFSGKTQTIPPHIIWLKKALEEGKKRLFFGMRKKDIWLYKKGEGKTKRRRWKSTTSP
jgi:hypothetical protein